MTNSTEAITEEVKANGQWAEAVQSEISRVIVGQKYLIDRLLVGLLANGHVLLEGVPGLAKTLAVKTLASCVDTKFQRLQFTPDLLPADIIGKPSADSMEWARKCPASPAKTWSSPAPIG